MLGDAWGSEPAASQFVVIGAAGSINIDDLNQRMEACLASNTPKSELERITNTVLAWLRGQRHA